MKGPPIINYISTFTEMELIKIMEIRELLTLGIQQHASDLHLASDCPPILRVDGELRRINCPAIDHNSLMDLVASIMNEKQRRHFKDYCEVDFSFDIPGIARFRVNVFQQNRGVAAAFRAIPAIVLGMEELGLPLLLHDLCNKPSGLVLVTGPTGSGKSTTLAAMIETINTHRNKHILTIEDPIEFIHESKQCLVNQREVYRDTLGFNEALRSALREDPDIILIGELRDLETIRLALTAAETGHLVLSTLHTQSAAKTISRIVDVFPSEEKSMVRAMLSESLQAVISQTLVKRIGGGRVAALEMMMCTNAIRHLIREDKIAQLYSTIQTGASIGMHTLDQHLQQLVTNQVILPATAAEMAVRKEAFV
jgi:twitching motility protein PilT